MGRVGGRKAKQKTRWFMLMALILGSLVALANCCMLQDLPAGFMAIPAHCRFLAIFEDKAGAALTGSTHLMESLARSIVVASLKHTTNAGGSRYLMIAKERQTKIVITIPALFTSRIHEVAYLFRIDFCFTSRLAFVSLSPLPPPFPAA